MPSNKIYSIYTRCDHCGVYDRDPAWCESCGRPKTGRPKQEQVPPNATGIATGTTARPASA